MKIHKIEDYSDKEIINLIITLISDHQMFIKSWGEFIFGKDLDLPPELKNRVFCIWFSGAIDTVIDEQDQYLPLLGEARKRKLDNCVSLLKQFEYFVDSIKGVVSSIDTESQLLLNHHRNTLVHARVFSIHNKKSVSLRFLNPETKKIERYKGNQEEFWEIHRNLIKGTMDEFFEPLREKFFDLKSAYYINICRMSKPDFSGLLTQKAYKDLKNVP
jgi:hypothetical protein